ncbi:hypothetical protein BOX15_Mlig006102g1, partial [Macrostomum lignano]
ATALSAMHNNRSSQSQAAGSSGDNNEGHQTGSAAAAVPVVRRVRLTSSSQLPSNYSQTPGGTIFGTTPGGTRVIYDRDFLLSRRDCPLARTPPAGLPRIPGVTCGGDGNSGGGGGVGGPAVNGVHAARSPESTAAVNGDGGGAGGTEFEMDI